MVEAPIPKDILKYKAKFIGNFSAREAACYAVGAVVALIFWFTVLPSWGLEAMEDKAIWTAIAFFIPASFAVIKPYGLNLEKALWIFIHDNLLTPEKRLKEVRYPELEKWQKIKSFEFTEDEAIVYSADVDSVGYFPAGTSIPKCAAITRAKKQELGTEAPVEEIQATAETEIKGKKKAGKKAPAKKAAAKNAQAQPKRPKVKIQPSKQYVGIK
jgi:hypothetical protein